MSSLASTPSDTNNERTPLLPRQTPYAAGLSSTGTWPHRPKLNTASGWPSSSGRSHRSSNGDTRSEESLKHTENESTVSQLSPSLLLENRGTVARDHLASERTFLAYVRTSLAVAAAGVALMQLFRLNVDPSNSIKHPIPAKTIAVGTILLSLCILGIGVSRYFVVQSSLVEGLYPARRWTLGDGLLHAQAAVLRLLLFSPMLFLRPVPPASHRDTAWPQIHPRLCSRCRHHRSGRRQTAFIIAALSGASVGPASRPWTSEESIGVEHVRASGMRRLRPGTRAL
ncbi:DUF202 domain-containing protein [Mycena chlorophos]|uniref:DUF202 domain-containing protein n=1 Tax=Mycena chlorophos TaxID=658473 RepID=A0A8H6TN25_MYCCL|nr:DUF202 domain-containing protein [Mycena chlorophos]